jgi:hypothetical protein
VDLFHVWLQILLAIEGVFLSASINILAATAAPAGICLDLLFIAFRDDSFSEYVQPTRL